MKRILFIMPSIPLQGMEKATITIARLLADAGCRIHFICEAAHGHRVIEEVERHGFSHSLVGFTEVPGLPRSWRSARRLLTLRRRCSAHLDECVQSFRPDAIHVTNLSYYLAFEPALRRFAGRVVFRLPNPPETELGRVRRLIWRLVWRARIGRVCDTIVCNSHYTAGIAEDFTNRRDIIVVRNCPPEQAKVEPSDAPTLPSDRFNIVFLGRVRPNKGAHILFDAAALLTARFPEMLVTVAGENDWQNPFAEGLMARVAEAGMQDVFQFVGQIKDVFGLLAQAQLHCCPSISAGDSFPNVTLEAKANGVASVVLPTAGLPEALTHGVDGYVCADRTAASLAEGLAHYLEDHQRAATAGRAALESLQARFSRARAGSAWQKVYDVAAA